MKYLSTRGRVSGLSFCEAVSMGLGSDGGLLVPERIPFIGRNIRDLSGTSYSELAFEIFKLYIDDIPELDLRKIVDKSYSNFSDPKVTPLVKVDEDYILELFHGPTLAFKDIALQFLGNVFEHILNQQNTFLNVLGATSGDTGSAAIAGLKGKKNINVFIMFPEGRTSSVQEKQMTTVMDSNIHSIAIDGSFDDCQSLLKEVFRDLSFKKELKLGAVNSVNWARVLAQTVYYFSIYIQLGMPKSFQVAVPTGNFGNIFSAYIAKQMGLPIERLILATNQNDILHRFFETGLYRRGEVCFTSSPAMDIQVASNFERYLFYVYRSSRVKFRQFINSFESSGAARIDLSDLPDNNDGFITSSVSDLETIKRIRSTYDRTGYILDPHTAVGLDAGFRKRKNKVPLVTLATAHPAKFPSLLLKALPEVQVLHPIIELLEGLPTRKEHLENDSSALKEFIKTVNH
ncbi:MAG: threonine synthase [Pseudomonadota bacterium]|nr:threonine synthase [Gammaproteobacteria bacterium]MEC8645071.1 threonine synthase [Pseudomonadota bacterium]